MKIPRTRFKLYGNEYYTNIIFYDVFSESITLQNKTCLWCPYFRDCMWSRKLKRVDACAFILLWLLCNCLGVVYHFIGDRIPLTGSGFLKHIKKIQLFLNMLLNILKTPKDLQLSKWSKEPTHITKSIYSPFFSFVYCLYLCFCI